MTSKQGDAGNIVKRDAASENRAVVPAPPEALINEKLTSYPVEVGYLTTPSPFFRRDCARE